MQNIMWGVGNWQDIGPNPHHSLIQTLLEENYSNSNNAHFYNESNFK